ncbi:MAG: head GIN domain-containing protein [Weeksellaceae bacterium]
MRIVFSLLFSFVFGFTFAQTTHNVGDFNAIEAFDQLSVILVPSDKNEIKISGAKADKVTFVNKSKSLKLRMELTNFLQGDRTTVTVYYKKLNSIRVSEGATVNSDETLDATSLSLNAKEGAAINLAVNSTKLDSKVTSGGIIQLRGNADTQDIVCNAGGVYEGKELTSKIANVTVNAGGMAEIYATEFVNAKTRAGGNINVFGGAEVSQSNFAGGNVNIH